MSTVIVSRMQYNGYQHLCLKTSLNEKNDENFFSNLSYSAMGFSSCFSEALGVEQNGSG